MEWKLLISILVIFISYYKFQHDNNNNKDNELIMMRRKRVALTVENMVKLSTSSTIKACNSNKKIAIGFNACIDLVINAPELFEKLVEDKWCNYNDFQVDDSITFKSSIKSKEQFIQHFIHIFQQGVAAEKFCSNQEMFTLISNKAFELKNTESVIGGNAAIMATRFVTNGCNVHLFSSYIGEETKKKLINSSKFKWHTIDKADDDVHLIVEYPRGNLFNNKLSSKLISPRHNRYIFTRDLNHQIPINLFQEAIKNNDISIIVLSGFHLFDGKASKKRDQQFNQTMNILKQLSSDIITHVEIAAIEEAQLYRDLSHSILKYTTSLGANEQETAAMYDALKNEPIKNSYPQHPKVIDTIKQMLFIMDNTNVKRFHVHNIGFQAICQMKSFGTLQQVQSSILEASLTASRQACQIEKSSLNPRDFVLLFPEHFSIDNNKFVEYNVTQPLTCWDTQIKTSQQDVMCCVIPVLVCKQPKRTVGLGDHISSAGLSIYI